MEMGNRREWDSVRGGWKPKRRPGNPAGRPRGAAPTRDPWAGVSEETLRLARKEARRAGEWQGVAFASKGA